MPTVAGGRDAAAQLAITRTSAVHLQDTGADSRLAQDGIRVPDEVSIVGFGDIPAARLVTPFSTTIAAPTRAQGVVAVHYLLTIIKGARPLSDKPTVLPVRLITRHSSAARILDPRRPASQLAV